MNKSFLLFLVLTGVSFLSNAQITAKKKAFGGSANLRFSPTSIQVNPSFGYFLSDSFALGASVGLNITETGATTSTTSDFGVSLRKYWSPMERVYVFAHAGVNYNTAGNGTVSAHLYPGAAYFFNDRLALEGSLAGLGRGGLGLFMLF